MKGLSTILILVSVALSFTRCDNIAKKKQPPNIVFFFVDDMGWQDTSVPFHSQKTQLNRQYHTPNMEQLAKEGVRFTQAYATALCSPSRISLMTGMNSARHMVTNWTLKKDQSPDPDHPVIQHPRWNVNGLSAAPGQERAVYAETLPELLKKAGYKTIHVGKAHFGAKNTSGEDPQNLGFDVNIAGHAAGGPGSYLGTYNYSANWRDPGNHVWDVPGLEKYHGTDTYLTEALTLEANEAVNQAVREKKPFYLYMSHYAIHAPWEKDDRFYQKYIDKGLSEFDAVYASMLEGMDKSLGDISANLKRLGVDQNTIIVLMSDNGAPKQAARNLPLRGHKLTPYEGGIRVPMIVKWPGVTKAGTINKQYLIIE
ncbi:MAG: sulfatase-like hydrolase/transferase, partial [Cytophagales bacterium]|nr:sulfatase-like hydrolase/transferase [Cytophagales bacterium]